ncbi:flavin reductase family protein [Calidifontibacter sp. DB0510]|uniref:Flavin reductase family protein n=1 Tax=Metallococcus carri TaxID=1656884 RepID=A0A967B1P2_9MICO|nr:flavin reductase family protein [Metallococcus carri]NHN57179.1 flavin reductase family protein [Metallococcus carri]NOP38018.1 flavin reductase family protein [Calidifontibacter sp. DB2511S]
MTVTALESGYLRTVLASYPTGVAALAGVVDGVPVGLAANSFTSVSLDPPLVSVCVAHTSSTWPVLRTAHRVGVSVLSAEQEEIGRVLSARGVDRFAGLRWEATECGAIEIAGAAAWLETSVDQVVTAGDHDIVVLRVHDAVHRTEVNPLVFHASRFRRLAC